MRITGGRARGIPLRAPRGGATRPATDRMREAVFSSLAATVENTRVLDLYAGSGAYGLEALSRGARQVRFCESNPQALACLRRNLDEVSRSCGQAVGETEILPCRVEALAPAPVCPDLIFLDPPYHTANDALQEVFSTHLHRLAGPRSRILLELPGHLEPDFHGWHLLRRIGKAGREKPTVAVFERTDFRRPVE